METKRSVAQSRRRKIPSPLNLQRETLDFGRRLYLMGVVNVTPDSFSDGGDFYDPQAAISHALELVEKGADILDIGGESTRPGADPVGRDEELDRVIPVIEGIRAEVDTPISIDTYKSDVAARALTAGADLINDVSAMRFDDNMANVIADAGTPVVLMHMQGDPRTMQDEIDYDDVVSDIYTFFEQRLDDARAAGIDEDKIILDPGIGFGKTVEQNYRLIRELTDFRRLGCPILLGTSRKSCIGAVTDNSPKNRLGGTAATVACGLHSGADIVRVHDVSLMRDVVDVTEAIANFPGSTND